MSQRSEEQRGSANGASAAAEHPIGETVRSKRAAKAASARAGAVATTPSAIDGLAVDTLAAAPAARLARDTAALIDLRAPELYLNRELTWLNFNRRVLHEAQDARTPLLERVKFLAIVNSNLDEFFMKRIGGLKQQVGAGVKNLTVDGRTPEQQIEECVAFVRNLNQDIHATYLEVVEALRRDGIILASWRDLGSAQQVLAARALSAQRLPAGHAAGDGPGAPVPVPVQPLAQSAGDAALPQGPRADARPGQGADRLRRAPVPAGRQRAGVRAARGGDGAQPGRPVSRHGFRGLRAVPGHPQRQCRAGRGGGGRSAGDDRIGAARPQVRPDRPARGGGGHAAAASRHARRRARPG